MLLFVARCALCVVCWLCLIGCDFVIFLSLLCLVAACCGSVCVVFCLLFFVVVRSLCVVRCSVCVVRCVLFGVFVVSYLLYVARYVLLVV